MANRRNNGRIPLRPGEILIRAAAVLFCLVLITTAMMAGLFARYTAKAAKEDSARVAAFNVHTSGSGDLAVSCAVQDGTYTITVTTDSEVAVAYDLIVTLEGELPPGVGMKLYAAKADAQDAAELIPAASGDGSTLTYEKAGTFPAGSHTAEHALTFTVDWTEFTKEETGIRAQESLDFTVDINAVQID